MGLYWSLSYVTARYPSTYGLAIEMASVRNQWAKPSCGVRHLVRVPFLVCIRGITRIPMAIPRAAPRTTKPPTSSKTTSKSAKSRRLPVLVPLFLSVALLACVAFVWLGRDGDVSLNVGWALIVSTILTSASLLVHLRVDRTRHPLRRLVLSLIGLLAGGYFLWSIPANLYSDYICSPALTFNVADIEYCQPNPEDHAVGLLVGALFICIHLSIWLARRRSD